MSDTVRIPFQFRVTGARVLSAGEVDATGEAARTPRGPNDVHLPILGCELHASPELDRLVAETTREGAATGQVSRRAPSADAHAGWQKRRISPDCPPAVSALYQNLSVRRLSDGGAASPDNAARSW